MSIIASIIELYIGTENVTSKLKFFISKFNIIWYIYKESSELIESRFEPIEEV